MLIFLLGLIVKRNIIMDIDDNFKIKSIKLNKNNKICDEIYNITPFLLTKLNEKLIINNQKIFLFL